MVNKKVSLLQDLVSGIPTSSGAYQLGKNSSKKYLSGLDTKCNNSNTNSKQSRVKSVIERMNKLGRRADSFANGIKEHVRLGPKISDTVIGKLSLGARILQVGGVQKIFVQMFSVEEGEKLLKASQCYLSTTSGPIAGLLFISTHKVAFCSERSLLQKVHLQESITR